MAMHLVTGGAGFIGSYLTRRLLDRGDQVTIVDTHPEHYLGDADEPGLRMIEGDVRDAILLAQLAVGAETIWHLASKVGVKHYLTDTADTITTIINGSLNVARAAQFAESRLVMLSTSEVYGKRASGRMHETDDTVFGASDRIRWCYGASKLVAEHSAIATFTNDWNRLRIVRPFNVVGPGQRAEGGLVFPSFTEAVRKRRPMLVHGTGEQTRSFIHVNDLINGLLRLETAETGHQVFNLGRRTPVSVYELACMFERLARDEFDRPDQTMRFVPHAEVYGERFEDTWHRAPDTARAEEAIGWDDAALVPLEAIVRESLTAAIYPQAVAQ